MTGRELLIYSLNLCGLMKNNAEIPNDAKDLEQRSVSLINIVIAENAVTDCRIRKIPHSVARIRTLEDVIDCSDIICRSVLPYGLARLFMLGEDDALASGFNKLYNEAREKAIGYGKAKAEKITEVYQ